VLSLIITVVIAQYHIEPIKNLNAEIRLIDSLPSWREIVAHPEGSDPRRKSEDHLSQGFKRLARLSTLELRSLVGQIQYRHYTASKERRRFFKMYPNATRLEKGRLSEMEDEDRMWLLVRYVFDVPTSVPREKARGFLYDHNAIRQDGTVNLAYPVEVRGGGAVSIIGTGFASPEVYLPLHEFDQLNRAFGRRRGIGE